MLHAFDHQVAQCCVRLANPAEHVSTLSDNVEPNMSHPFGQGGNAIVGNSGYKPTRSQRSRWCVTHPRYRNKVPSTKLA